MRIKKLCEAIQIGEIYVKNRMVMPAMLIRDGINGGFISEWTKFHFEKRAKGGAGLIIVGACIVDYGVGRLMDEQLSIDDDRFIPGLREIAEIIHKYETTAAVHLQHGGNVAKPDANLQPVAPSTVARPGHALPRELTLNEINEITAKFAKSAERAQRAGFDAVEISACHRYLVQNFLSSAWNKRQDQYGGHLKNRARFLMEIIEAIKLAVGQNYPILVRINGMEYGVEGGTTIEEAKEVALMLQDAGINALSVSAFPANYPYPASLVSPTLPIFRPGCYAHLAAAVKKVVRIPVIAAGRISPELGENLIRKGKADLIAFARGLIVDAELPDKVINGKLDEIRRCVGCQECYNPSGFARQCTVNAAAFDKEPKYLIKVSPKRKKVLIVGGGPAGMEAARVAALRGHEVLLYEKGKRLGGQLLPAIILREEYETLRKFLATQMEKLGIKVMLGKEVTPAIVENTKPDAVVIAMGPVAHPPKIPAINANIINIESLKKRKVIWYIGWIFMKNNLGRSIIKWLLRFGIIFGKRVIVMGGGLGGSEIANFLSELGKKVIIVTDRDDISDGVGTMPVLKQYFLEKLAALGVEMLIGVKYEMITKKGLCIITKEGEKRIIEAGSLVYTDRASPNMHLYNSIKGKIPEIYVAGDSSNPAGVMEAISDGFRIGLEL